MDPAGESADEDSIPFMFFLLLGEGRFWDFSRITSLRSGVGNEEWISNNLRSALLTVEAPLRNLLGELC